MKKMIYCLAIIILGSNFSCCSAQQKPVAKCDTKELVSIEKRVENLKYADIVLFVSLVDEDCLNNAEFTEYHNELLFKITSFYPSEVLKSISNISAVKRKIILDEYSLNVSDANIGDLKKKISSVRGFDKTKKKIYQALDLNK